MMKRIALIAAIALAASCGPRPSEEPAAVSAPENAEGAESGPAPPTAAQVDPALLAAPNTAFAPIEPSEVGVLAAPSVTEALSDLLSPEVEAEGGELFVTTRESGELTIADIVRTNLPDDSVGASHLRFEFRREPEGWFPTNAYRRMQCRRGESAGQWSAALCP